jgi:tripartite-type tricarboxylate transporter receptor subunit TctC
MKAIVACAIAIAACAASIDAPRADDFYAGKTITIVSYGGAGNNYDAYSRLLTRHLGKYIPGHPRFVVVNMPGAGGITAANYVARVAPQDGTVIHIVSDGLLMFEATGRKGLQDSLGKFRWLGALSASNMVTSTWYKSGIKSIEDAKKHKVRLGGSGAGAMSSVVPMLYNSFAGTQFVIVQGYKSAPAQHLAMDRGEIDGRGAASWTSMKNLLGKEIEEGKLHVLGQIGVAKEPELPNVPLLTELAGKDPENLAIATFVSKALTFSRSVIASPRAPEAQVTILRKALADAVKDPALLAEVKKLRMDIGFVPGEQEEKVIREVLATPKSVIANAQEAMKLR